MEKQFLLPASVREALMQYLYSRPYGEVAQGVAALGALKEYPPADPVAHSVEQAA